MPRPKKLSDFVVVITGASSGIGRATALEFARRGATVVLVARRADALSELAVECAHLGGRAQVAPLDVTDGAAVAELARAVAKHHGRIDAWINNAGVALFGAFDKTPPELFRRVIETNLFGYAHGARAALAEFREQGHGVLLNVVPGSSVQADASAYCASQLAIEGLGACLRAEWASTPDIHVCTIVSGVVDTPLLQQAGNFTGRPLAPTQPLIAPQRVARSIVACVEKPRASLQLGVSRAHVALHRLSAGVFPAEAAGRQEESAVVDAFPGNLFDPGLGWTSLDGGWRRARRVGPGWLTRKLLVAASAIAPRLESSARLSRPFAALEASRRRALRAFGAEAESSRP